MFYNQELTPVLQFSTNLATPPKLSDPNSWIPFLFSLFGYSTFADLQEKNISTRPEDWWKATSSEEVFEGVRGATLSGSNLRYADAWYAFLAKANLDGANLQGALFTGADFQEASLERANLQDTMLEAAKLQDAYLAEANLQGANLSGADLRGANLGGADLRGAYLQDAKNVTQEQLDSACGNKETFLPKDLTIEYCQEDPIISDG
jgi:uncharacterized protein YjbI with pentapeptide repeats